jgi:hypothetical protein
VDEAPNCPRHPDVETRLRCSACDTLICANCAVEAAVGYKCPDCGRHPAEVTSGRAGGRGKLGDPQRWSRPARPSTVDDGARLPAPVAARATGVGAGSALAGGLLLGPILATGMLFLISAGVIGWGVARAVYWATEERNSSYVQALALTAAGSSVMVGIGTATAFYAGGREPALLLLAFPAALYGGWIVVRQR